MIDSVDILPSPGEESYAGGITFDRIFDEVWGGLTYSLKLSELVGFGLTGYLAYRSQKSSRQSIIQVLPDSGDIRLGYLCSFSGDYPLKT